MARKSNKINVTCSTCGKPKIITERAFNSNKTQRFYCNYLCRQNDKFKQIEVICENCNQKFIIHKSQYDRNKSKRFTCSINCLSESRTIEIKCDFCNKNLLRKEAEYNKAKYHFCDTKCLIEWKKNKIKERCSFCGKDILSRPEDLENKKNRFCSRRCLSQWQHLNWQDENHPNFSQVEVECCVCFKKKKVTRAVFKRYKKFYCSIECISEGKLGEKSPTWLGGISFGEYDPGFNKISKRKVRERDNNRCQICGLRYVKSQKNLAIHHKDYNKKNSLFTNLVTLCRSCHAKTNHNRDFWQRWFKSSSSFWFAARCM